MLNSKIIFSLNQEICGTQFIVDIPEGLSLLMGEESKSGAGKTFLFDTLVEVASDPEFKINIRRFNYLNRNDTFDTFKAICLNQDIILFGNLDLYYTDELLDMALEHAKAVVLAMRGEWQLGERRYYDLEPIFTTNRLEVKNRGLL